MNAVLAGDAGFVAVGAAEATDREGLDAAVWASSDGASWQRVRHDETSFGAQAGASSEMWALASTGPTLVVVGNARVGTQDDPVAAGWIGRRTR